VSAGVVMARAESALRTFRELGDRCAEVDILALIAFAHRHRGDVEESSACADAAMAMAEAAGHELGQCRLWYLRAVISREQGRYEDAAACAERCLDLADRIGTVHDRVLALWELAAACRGQEAVPPTSHQLRAGIEICRRRGKGLLEAYLLLALGDLYVRSAQPGARPIIERALSVFRDQAVPFGQGVGLRLLGGLDHADGDVAQAVTHLTRSVATARKVRNVHEQALALKALGNAYLAAGDRLAAEEAWEEARGLFEQLGNKAEAATVDDAVAGCPAID
jgi:tetratricopeptide (TPR) repeat protein